MRQDYHCEHTPLLGGLGGRGGGTKRMRLWHKTGTGWLMFLETKVLP